MTMIATKNAIATTPNSVASLAFFDILFNICSKDTSYLTVGGVENVW